MNRLRKIILNIVIATITFNAIAIQLKTAQMISGAIGIGALGTSTVAWRTTHPAIFAALSGLLSGVSYYYLYQITPDGRLQRVSGLINQLNKNTLATIHFYSKDKFFDAVYDIYIDQDLPLISAYCEVLNLLPLALLANQLIKTTQTEVRQNDGLAKICNSFQLHVKQLIKNITRSLKYIRNNQDYLPQLKIYKQFFAAEKACNAQEQLVASYQQLAFAQKSSTILQWLRAIFGLC